MKLTILKNLFPDDTRIAELTSAIAFSIVLVLGLFGFIQLSLALILLGCGALVQLGTLVIFSNSLKTRVSSSLLLGGLLIYFGIPLIVTNLQEAVLYLVLGFANLYAFLVNNQRLKWN